MKHVLVRDGVVFMALFVAVWIVFRSRGLGFSGLDKTLMYQKQKHVPLCIPTGLLRTDSFDVYFREIYFIKINYAMYANNYILYIYLYKHSLKSSINGNIFYTQIIHSEVLDMKYNQSK